MRDQYRFFYEGFDLFSFPQNAHVLFFNLFRFVERLARRYRREGIDGILSNNEQFGALAASMLAERMGLSAPNPRALIVAQHKYYAREALKAGFPHLLPDYGVFPYEVKSAAEIGLAFPFFVKPVKATFSVLARRVDSFEELARHLDFSFFEALLIKRLVKPFNDAMAAMTDLRIDAHHFIAESLLEGVQVSVDGMVAKGKPRALGMVDAAMYPGTNAFLRFDYPSRLPRALRDAVYATAEEVVTAMGYDHGFFNAEFMVDATTKSIKLIEVNPRMASQFSDLYEKVEGESLHEMALRLSCGEEPRMRKGTGRNRHAASFVFRRFDGRPASLPAPEKLAWLASFDPDARLMMYPKSGRALAREMKWLGSHRYAVLNMGAESESALEKKYRTVAATLGLDPLT